MVNVNKLKTNDEFIRESILKHGERYNYSLVKYLGNKIDVTIICKEHGIFFQTPKSHLRGSGCPRCSRMKPPKYNRQQILTIFNEKHNYKFDYSKFIFTDMTTKSIIICKDHGEFLSSPKNHRLYGCKKCYYDKIGDNLRKDNQSFIKDSIKKHGELYDYSKVTYINSKDKVEIICKVHGSFKQAPSNHLSGQGCPFCKVSKGEFLIEKFLLTNELNYYTQFSFSDCRSINPLKFDFYLPDFNICIEFDGRQHYSKNKSESYFYDEDIKNRDNIKK
jgi:hypothetical protein